MPNLQGASPIGRDEGGRSYAAQTVSEGGRIDDVADKVESSARQ